MRACVQGLAIVPLLVVLTGGCGPESLPSPAVARSPLTVSGTYLNASATLTVPDYVEPGTEFPITLSGTIANGTAWTIGAWFLWENAVWSYDAMHVARVSSGTFIAGSGFAFGDTFNSTIRLTRPAGTYSYTFVFGSRIAHNSTYDVAIDATVQVGHPEQAICGAAFSTPGQHHRAGRVIPIKFTASDCATGQFLRDEEVTVSIRDPGGSLVASLSYTGNPHTGVAIDDIEAQYHANWQTTRDQSGLFTVVVTFGTGDQITETILVE